MEIVNGKLAFELPTPPSVMEPENDNDALITPVPDEADEDANPVVVPPVAFVTVISV